MRTLVLVLWGAVGVYWLIAAAGAKEGSRRRRSLPPGLLLVVAVVLLRVLHTGGLAVHSPALRALGVVLLVAGLGLAVWARIFLGRNWGMPMTLKQEPELVTAGPYRFVRHPIYSGLLLAGLGTALASNLYWLIAWGVMALYFIYAARTEERLMLASFPSAYPGYRARTKMLIPFIL
jgi:protein-S-isoprenylcysteine O-methyltransferase Ste14